MAWAMFISPWKWSLILPLHVVDIHCTELAAAEASFGSCKPDSKNCKIGNAVRLGPYVSIGDNCILENCNIENSILMKDCKVYAQVDLSSSIIAHGSQIDGGHDVITKSHLLLGERTHLKL